jgi:homoserine O-acetyltransferase
MTASPSASPPGEHARPPLRAVPTSRGHWAEGDDPGDRLFVDVGPVDLEAGGHLPAVRLAYETWGSLDDAGDNAVLVEHALTGDSHVEGPAGPGHPTAGWWDGLIGPGRPLDTDRWFVVAPNVLGGCQGSTGPSSAAPDGRPWGGRFPFVTIRDQVAVEARLADRLGIDRWAAVVGGSMGGMRVIEWAVDRPERVASAIVLASTAAASADQIAWARPQLLAIESDPAFHGGDYYGRPQQPDVGMGIARRIAHLTYRSAFELDDRFGRTPQDASHDVEAADVLYAVESYLDHHARKLAGRFDPNSYLTLTRAMNAHDVGRGRGGRGRALARVTADTLAIGVTSDRLYPVSQAEEIAASVPRGRLAVVSSPHGHDGFLIEVDAVGELVREHLSGHR